MSPGDVAAAERVSAEAFYDLDQRTYQRSWPEPRRRSSEHAESWRRRTARFLRSDPDGCWVAMDDDGMVGFATSMVRERLWILATFAVRPGAQGRGVGREVLAHAEAYAAGCDRGLLAASDDPMALRRYHAAGFALHPQLLFHGEVDRSVIPVVTGLRDGTPDDRQWMDDLDRDLRGGPHGPDHLSLAEAPRLVVAEDRSGYAYASPGAAHVIAARDEGTASRLLWECLAGAEADFELPHVTTANPWAVDVAMAARLSAYTRGFLAVRGMALPAPYVHHGALL